LVERPPAFGRTGWRSALGRSLARQRRAACEPHQARRASGVQRPGAVRSQAALGWGASSSPDATSTPCPRCPRPFIALAAFACRRGFEAQRNFLPRAKAVTSSDLHGRSEALDNATRRYL